MKVLHLSTYDTGGAGRAVYRLHHGLLARGVSSQMLVQQKKSQDEPAITASNTGPFSARLRRLRLSGEFVPNKFYPNRQKTSFSSQWLPEGVAAQINRLGPTVINLHWINHGFVRVESIARLNRPLVWTLHDMWPFTGGCHYSGECDRYSESCGSCPLLNSQRAFDLSRLIWLRKSKNWARVPFHIVAPSRWLANCAKASSLFNDLPIEIIPHGLDLDVYNPTSKQTARAALNLPQDKQIVLFGALKATSDGRKGFSYLTGALEQLAHNGWREKIELVVFGASDLASAENLGFRSSCLGHVKDEKRLSLAYSAADVMVVPSTQEAFGQTAFEALACGTPVVAFNATGLKDIVSHNRTGYLAKPFSTIDLARGIAWVIEDTERHMRLCRAARSVAEKEFSLRLQATRYLSLYEKLAHSQLLEPV